MALAFPLAKVSKTFPREVDARLETEQMSLCLGRMFICMAQTLYQADQFKDAPDHTLELVANQPGLTCLMLASLEGDIGAARVLLERGASVGLVNCYGRNALIMAAMSGNTEVVELLLQVDAPIDAVDAWDRDALSWARHRQHQIITRLLQQKADAQRDRQMARLAGQPRTEAAATRSSPPPNLPRPAASSGSSPSLDAKTAATTAAARSKATATTKAATTKAVAAAHAASQPGPSSSHLSQDAGRRRAPGLSARVREVFSARGSARGGKGGKIAAGKSANRPARAKAKTSAANGSRGARAISGASTDGMTSGVLAPQQLLRPQWRTGTLSDADAAQLIPPAVVATQATASATGWQEWLLGPRNDGPGSVGRKAAFSPEAVVNDAPPAVVRAAPGRGAGAVVGWDIDRPGWEWGHEPIVVDDTAAAADPL